MAIFIQELEQENGKHKRPTKEEEEEQAASAREK
jgi:hypothetical protein